MSDKTAKSSAADFVHLHNHTHHSVLDGLQKIPAMVDRAKELGMSAIAVTDHGTLSGAIEFYKTAREAGIKPIIGMEAYVANRLHTDKDPQQDKQRFHLILLAMNNQGYENLMRLSSIANLDGFYHKPRIDRELLERYGEGLIVLSGCIGGELGDALRRGDEGQAKKVAQWYKRTFGDRYYIEIQDHSHEWDEQRRVNDKLLKLSKELEIPAVVTADAHYLSHDDQQAHEVLLSIQTGSFLSDEGRMSLADMELHLTDPKEVIERWQDREELITNTRVIAERCQVEIELGKILIPTFDVPKGDTEKSYLHRLTWQGLAWRYGGVALDASKKLSVEQSRKLLSEDVIKRAEFELGVIGNMGFDGYFLIVADFIVWGKEQGIMFGPGRGSAAGSIVSYAIRITELDPLKYDLLFERFLNPDRISMPDIDIDIQDSRRDEVIKYCIDKYGQDKVAHIITFGTMAARNAIRDVARVLEVPYQDADRLAKMVPPPVQGRHIPLSTSIEKNAELRAEYQSNEQSRRVIDLAIKLEGTIRSHGVHAAGVVIAPQEIVKYTPIEMSQKGVVTTQYPMYPIEDLGLLKMDFLGLSNLTIIKNALRIVRKVYGQEINVADLPLDDIKTYELLGRGDTTGIFQFESGGMKRYLKQLKPEVFEDIVAMGALYRPGPLTAGLTDKFINRKNGTEPVEYEHPDMKPALSSTYGVLVYQEQVMRIARDMCGFSGGQADTLRKAIGKKNLELMAKMKQEFVEGMVAHSGADKSFAEKFWKDLEGFADYAFNKSHSACYGMISYQTAYLKAHYPSAFMAALMTSDFNDTERLAIEISECQHMGLEVLPPDINESFIEFAVVPETNQIRFGMAAIKNVGTGVVEEIVHERDNRGKFTSVEDFAKRMNPRLVNKKVWESLIKCGAFDRFEERTKLLANLDLIIAFAQKMGKEAASGQINLFGESTAGAGLRLEGGDLETPEKDALTWERELLGIYLSKHPLDAYQDKLDKLTKPISDVTTGMEGKTVKIGGVISIIREITTKNGARMAFVTIEDKSGELEVIAFPNIYSEKADLWQQDKVVLISGKVSTKDRSGAATEEIKILADNIEAVDGSLPSSDNRTSTPNSLDQTPLTSKPEQKLFIHIKKPQDNDLLLRLKQILNQHPGNSDAVLVFGTEDKSAVKLPFGVEPSQSLQSALRELLDSSAVAVR